MQKTTVLIVGAGPTGLMMACQLTLQHIPFILVEKDSGPTTQSRALGIQARSVEIFAQMGLAEKFLKEGKPARGFNVMINGHITQHVPLSDLGKGQTQFPFMLMLEQSKTEQILINFLEANKQQIHWNTEVLSFTQDEQKIVAIIKTQASTGGQTESPNRIEADWIVGADGAHSIVRHTLGIKLAGKTYKQSLFVLDCKISSSLPKDEISVAFSKSGFAAFFPMTKARWRIVGEVPPEAYGKDTITFADVKKSFAQQMQMDIALSDPLWISLYHSHHRCVETFKKGRSFLLGDAAHIHSPIGAQGMNTGLQDAYNLAWKLAFVHTKRSPISLLETYTAERLPFAHRLVQTTDRAFNLAVATNPLAVFFRLKLLPRIVQQVMHHSVTGRFMFRTVSQIAISYHTSPLSQQASFGEFPASAPRPGDRLPYAVMQEHDQQTNIQQMISSGRMQLLLFADETQKIPPVENIIMQYDRSIGVSVIHYTKEIKQLYQQFGIKKSGYYLVRPDMYIAARSSSPDTTPLKDYLSRFLLSS